MMLIVVILQDYCTLSTDGWISDTCQEIAPLRRSSCILILVFVETIIITPMLLWYLGRFISILSVFIFRSKRRTSL